MFRFLLLDYVAIRIRIFEYLYIYHSGSIAKLASFSDARAYLRYALCQSGSTYSSTGLAIGPFICWRSLPCRNTFLHSEFSGGMIHMKIGKGIDRELLLLILFLTLGIFGAIGIYALLASDITKVDVSGPDPDGPVIVPENYQNLLALDITVPGFDAGRIGLDVKLHNGPSGSQPRDILIPFSSTDWYSDHNGDATFDGNEIPSNAEAIISSGDGILDSSDAVRKRGLCLIEFFDYSDGTGEQHIDSNGSDSYTSGEAILRTSTAAGEAHPGEIIRSGTADMTSFPAGIRFIDGINGSLTPVQYDNGEAIISSSDGTLDSGDTVLTPGSADLTAFPADVVYSDFNGNGKYGIDEVIVSDGGISGQLDAGLLNGSGVDAVIRAGNADLRVMNGEGLLFADDNNDDDFTTGELIVDSADLSVDIGEVELSGSANLKPMTGLSFADNNNNNQPNTSELIIKNTGSNTTILEAADNIASPGSADLRAFTVNVEQFVDNNGNTAYDDGECIVRDGDGAANLLSSSDTIVKSGPAFLTAFSSNIKWADVNGNSQYDGEELLVSSSDDVLNPGEVVKPGYCDLELIYSGRVYSDNDDSGTYSVDELMITSADTILDAGDVVVTPGEADMLSFKDDSSTWYIDADAGADFDSNEAIIHEGNGDNILYLDDDDAIARTGTANIRSFADNVVYIDHDSDGSFQGDSDNDVNLDDGDDTTFANDPDVTDDQDEVVLNDPAGPDHLALDDGDSVLRPGMARLTLFPATYKYTDDGNESYDGGASREAVIMDINSDGLLDSGDEVVVSGEALIKVLSPPNIRYIDDNDDGIFTTGEAVILDGGPGDVPNGLLDAGPLDETGTDRVIANGTAKLTAFRLSEKFVDGNLNGTYEPEEAIVYDWYKLDDFEGEYILAGNVLVPGVPGTGVLTYQTPAARYSHGDCVLVPSTVGSAAMVQLNAAAEYRYIDDNDASHANAYGGFYTGTYESILWSANDQLEEGDLVNDGVGDDYLLAAGYAGMRKWTGSVVNMAWTDHNHDGDYQSNEAIVDDAGGDGIITIIGTSPGHDNIVVAGDADLNAPAEMKYVDANDSGKFDEGVELEINDANLDDMIQNTEIEAAGPVPFLEPLASAPDDYRYCDADSDSDFDTDEAVVRDTSSPGVLGPGDEVVAAGTLPLQNFNAATDRYADSDHNAQYDYSVGSGFGDAIIVNTTGSVNEVEVSDNIKTDGYADLQTFSGTHKYSDHNRDDEFTDGELVVNDLNGNDDVDTGEIIRAGLANLKAFPVDVMYVDDDGNNLYSNSEAIVRTGDTNLGSDDEVLSPGVAGLYSFVSDTYRFTDADHDNVYDQGEAIIVESGWDVVDDVLEDSDVIVLEGAADIEQFPSNFMFLDDGADSNTYEGGEAVVKDSNGNNLLNSGEIITGGRAALRRFTSGERYTDAGNGANARNSQYDPDEAIIRDGNYNSELDVGPLNGDGNDTVLLAGEAGLTQFDSDGLPASPNCDDEHYVDADGNGLYDGNEDIYQDRDNNNMVTIGNDTLEYLAVENSGTATNSDLADVELWADRDGDDQFEPDTDDAPAIISLVPDVSNTRRWYEGPATAPPLSAVSARELIDYAIPADGQRFFVTVDTGGAPVDGRDIQMRLPLNGVKTVFGISGPSDTTMTNAYAQKIDFANPGTADITSPAADSVIYGLTLLQANVSDTVQVGKVEFYDSPPGGGNIPVGIDDDGAPWEVTWDSSSAGIGSHTLYVRVYDRAYLRPPSVWGIDHYTDSPGTPVIISPSYAVPLADGWNLASVPVETFDTSIDSVIALIDGDCVAFWAYDTAILEWIRYEPDGPDFLNDLDAVHTGVGYWILMDGPGTLNIYGAVPDTVITLHQEWNLVGCNSLTPLDIADATSSIECDFQVWTIDPNTGEWLGYAPGDPLNDLDVIEPGVGYWFYVAESCVWDIAP